MSDFEPGKVMAAVDEGADRLERAADELAKATQDAGRAEAAYEQAFEKELLRIYHAAQERGERMPAEDVRRALAHERIDAKLYATHLLAKAELAAQEKSFRGLLQAVSARQSVLKALGGLG